jgi:hypothetical protein
VEIWLDRDIAAKGGCFTPRLEIEINSSAQVAPGSLFTSPRFARSLGPACARALLRFSTRVLLLLVGKLEKSLDLSQPVERLSHRAAECFELGKSTILGLDNCFEIGTIKVHVVA